MPECILEDLARGTTIPFLINGTNPTFRLKTERITAAALRSLGPAAEDLLDVAAAVFYADGQVSRGGTSRTNMGAAWHRQLRLTIPVRDPALWQRQDVTEALTSALHLLTDDHFQFRFVANNTRATATGFLDLDPTSATFEADDVIMFSGGLDSYSGALDTLSTGHARVLLVSHQSAPKVSERQRELATDLMKRFPGRVMHIRIPANRAGDESTDTTQRSRSLLFTAMGAVVATAFGARTVNFFENGIVSHNLPVSRQIVGSMASRTTHPLGLLRLQTLISLVLPDAPRVVNRYEWMTKSDVLDRIKWASGEKNICVAVSCTRVRDQTKIHTHCGECSQCLDRRFAVIACGLEAYDPPESYATDVLVGPRQDTGSATLPVFWTQHFTALAQRSFLDFFSAFGLELSRLAEAYPEIPREDCLQKIFDLHRRQSKIVLDVLERQITAFAPFLAKSELPETSLLVMHIGQGKAPEKFAPGLQPVRLPQVAVGPHLAEDDPVDPHGPVTLLFSLQDGQPTVGLKGICDLTGPSARITHLLRVPHDEDKKAGAPPEEHRYVHIASLPGAQMTKSHVRTILTRSRNRIRDAYRELFGCEPPPTLVYQNKPTHGHRLNPYCKVLDDE
jgi:7-cyano-7-deazaguanine synthase in queuosine biosynthesis